MNTENIAQISKILEALSSLDASQIFAKKKGESLSNNSKQNTLSFEKFEYFFDKVVKSFILEIESDDAFLLPDTFARENNIYSIKEILNSLKLNIQLGDFENAQYFLVLTIQYAKTFSFYEKNQLKNQIDSVIKMKREIEEYRRKYKQFYDKIEALSNRNIEAENKREEYLSKLANTHDESNRLLIKINSLVKISENNNNEVNVILSEANAITNDYKRAKIDIEQIHNEINLLLHQTENEISSQKDTWNMKYEEVDKRYDDFEQKSKIVEDKAIFFEERNNYLNELIGREVGTSLFKTFNQRKNEISPSLKIWQISVWVASFIAIIVIFAIFTNFFGLFGAPSHTFTWQEIIVNAIKSSPAIFLLYYTISQYNKERNFQEEYAFKSAAALTIKAYADILKDDAKKDELILRSVSGVYRSPIINKYNTKSDLNSLTDLAKELIGKGSEVLPKSNKS